MVKSHRMPLRYLKCRQKLKISGKLLRLPPHYSFQLPNSDFHRWIPTLPRLFAQYDLEDIKQDFAFEQPWQSKMAADGSCAVVHEMASNGSPFIADKLKRVGVDVPKAYEEVCEGSRLTQPFCVTVGRKPIQKSAWDFGLAWKGLGRIKPIVNISIMDTCYISMEI